MTDYNNDPVTGSPAPYQGGYPAAQQGGYPAAQPGGYPAPQQGGYPAAGGFSPYGQQPGYPAAQPAGAYPVVLTIGDIAVTQTEVIVPTGRFPLRGSNWTVQDSTQATESIPAYAVVLAIIFFMACLLGLLFLLIKEKKYSGFVSITVTGEGLYHSVQLPPGPVSAGQALHQVNQARAMAASAP